MRWKRFGAIACLVTQVSGCSANWQPTALPRPEPLDERTVLEFHIVAGKKDSTVRLHGVRFTKDSVSGIDWLHHTSCGSCRVSYAITETSRPQVGHPARTAWTLAIVGGVLGGAVLVYVWALSHIPYT